MQTKTCHTAIHDLQAYLDNPELSDAMAAVAINHVKECRYCQNRVGQLIWVLLTDETDVLTCEKCLDQLPDYLQSKMDGAGGAPQWHEVSLHLATCPYCAIELAELSQLVALSNSNQLRELPRYPVPDLSFLHPKDTKSTSLTDNIIWRLDELGRLLIDLSDDLIRAFQLSAQQLAPVKSTSSRILCALTLAQAVEDMEVEILAEEERRDPIHCKVSITINMPSRGGWPNLAGSEVMIKEGEQELGTKITDAHGTAVFRKIATDSLPDLTFTITSGA